MSLEKKSLKRIKSEKFKFDRMNRTLILDWIWNHDQIGSMIKMD